MAKIRYTKTIHIHVTIKSTKIMAMGEGTWHFSSLSIIGLTRIKIKIANARGRTRDEQSFITAKNNTIPIKEIIPFVLLSIIFPLSRLYFAIAKGSNIV